MVKNPSANARDVGSISGPGRSHVLRRHPSPCAKTTEPVLWSPGAATTELTCLEPMLCNEKPLQLKAHALQIENSPCLLQLEKTPCSNKDPAQPKSNKHCKAAIYCNFKKLVKSKELIEPGSLVLSPRTKEEAFSTRATLA